MENENRGRGNNFPDSTDLWNEADRFTFPLLHNEVSHSGNRENGPVSFMQQQVSSSPTGNFHGEPAHCIGHASAGSLSSMMSNVTEHNNLRLSSLHNPVIPGVFYQGESNSATSFSALSRSQSYDLNHNVQKQVGPSGSYSQLDINRGLYQAESSDLRSFSALNRRQSYDLNRSVQIHDVPPDSGSDVNILSHGPHNFDGRFLSLGHNDSAGSKLESYASAGHYNSSRLSFPPSKQETSHGPFYPQGLPSGTIGCLALSNNGYGTLPGLSSGFDASASLLSSGQLFDPNQLISAADGRSPVMGNHLNSRYTDTASKAYQIIPSGSHSNGQFRSSESGSSGILRLPSEATTTSGIRQQLTAVENHGLYMTSNAVSPFQSPTCFPSLGTSNKKNEHDEASQRRIMHAPPSGSFSEIYIAPAADNAVSSSSRTEMVNDSNVVGKRTLKRGSSITSEPPRKLIRHHTIGPSHFLVNPSPPQSSAFTGISQQLIQQSFQSPKIAPHQNTPRTTVPAFTPPSNPFSIDAHAKTVPAPQQTSISKSAAASTNTIHRPVSPSLYHHRPSAMSPVQIANPPLNSLERAAVRKPLPNHTAQKGSLSNRTAAAEHAKTVVRRFFERQANALATFKKNTAAPHSSVTTARMPYIRSQDVYKPEARGLKCLVCKRDLGYTAEGPERIAPCPPNVAVLPCGHVFHDHCLVAITPQDQRANPPCIPCSMNDSA